MPGHSSSLANWDGALSTNLKHDLTHTQTIKTDQHTPATSTPRVNRDIPHYNHKIHTQPHSQSSSQIAPCSRMDASTSAFAPIANAPAPASSTFDATLNRHSRSRGLRRGGVRPKPAAMMSTGHSRTKSTNAHGTHLSSNHHQDPDLPPSRTSTLATSSRETFTTPTRPVPTAPRSHYTFDASQHHRHPHSHADSGSTRPVPSITRADRDRNHNYANDTLGTSSSSAALFDASSTVPRALRGPRHSTLVAASTSPLKTTPSYGRNDKQLHRTSIPNGNAKPTTRAAGMDDRARNAYSHTQKNLTSVKPSEPLAMTSAHRREIPGDPNTYSLILGGNMTVDRPLNNEGTVMPSGPYLTLSPVASFSVPVPRTPEKQPAREVIDLVGDTDDEDEIEVDLGVTAGASPWTPIVLDSNHDRVGKPSSIVLPSPKKPFSPIANRFHSVAYTEASISNSTKINTPRSGPSKSKNPPQAPETGIVVVIDDQLDHDHDDNSNTNGAFNFDSITPTKSKSKSRPRSERKSPATPLFLPADDSDGSEFPPTPLPPRVLDDSEVDEDRAQSLSPSTSKLAPPAHPSPLPKHTMSLQSKTTAPYVPPASELFTPSPPPGLRLKSRPPRNKKLLVVEMPGIPEGSRKSHYKSIWETVFPQWMSSQSGRNEDGNENSRTHRDKTRKIGPPKSQTIPTQVHHGNMSDALTIAFRHNGGDKSTHTHTHKAARREKVVQSEVLKSKTTLSTSSGVRTHTDLFEALNASMRRNAEANAHAEHELEDDDESDLPLAFHAGLTMARARAKQLEKTQGKHDKGQRKGATNTHSNAVAGPSSGVKITAKRKYIRHHKDKDEDVDFEYKGPARKKLKTSVSAPVGVGSEKHQHHQHHHRHRSHEPKTPYTTYDAESDILQLHFDVVPRTTTYAALAASTRFVRSVREDKSIEELVVLAKTSVPGTTKTKTLPQKTSWFVYPPEPGDVREEGDVTVGGEVKFVDYTPVISVEDTSISHQAGKGKGKRKASPDVDGDKRAGSPPPLIKKRRIQAVGPLNHLVDPPTTSATMISATSPEESQPSAKALGKKKESPSQQQSSAHTDVASAMIQYQLALEANALSSASVPPELSTSIEIHNPSNASGPEPSSGEILELPEDPKSVASTSFPPPSGFSMAFSNGHSPIAGSSYDHPRSSMPFIGHDASPFLADFSTPPTLNDPDLNLNSFSSHTPEGHDDFFDPPSQENNTIDPSLLGGITMANLDTRSPSPSSGSSASTHSYVVPLHESPYSRSVPIEEDINAPPVFHVSTYGMRAASARRHPAYKDMVPTEDLHLSSSSDDDDSDDDYKSIDTPPHKDLLIPTPPRPKTRKVIPVDPIGFTITTSSSNTPGPSASASARSSLPPKTGITTKSSSTSSSVPPKKGRGRGMNWPLGTIPAFCHQCRARSLRLFMTCVADCEKVYCVKCISTRYNGTIIFDEMKMDFLCPSCKGKCTCDVCTRKRGEVYEPLRTYAPPDMSVFNTRKPSQSPATIPSVQGPVTYWGTIYSVTGCEKVGQALKGDTDLVVPQYFDNKTNTMSNSNPNPDIQPKPQKRVFIGAVQPSWVLGSVKIVDNDPPPRSISKGKGKGKGKGKAVQSRMYIGNKALLFAPSAPAPGAKAQSPSTFSTTSSLTPLPESYEYEWPSHTHEEEDNTPKEIVDVSEVEGGVVGDTSVVSLDEKDVTRAIEMGLNSLGLESLGLDLHG